VRRQYTIGAQRRMTINATQIAELAGQDFSTMIFTSGKIVAERSMLWRPIGTPAGTPWVGGHTSLGATGASNEWDFAEGATSPGFETFYLLFNPTADPIDVVGNYFTESFGVVRKLYTLAPHTRATAYLNGEIGNLGGVAASFTSRGLFVAERSIYWGQGRVEGTNTFGVTGPARTWTLPEGSAGGQFETFLLLGNPINQHSVVDISLQIEGYGQVTLPASQRPVVPAYGRVTLYMPTILRQLEVSEGVPPGTFATASFATTVRVFAGAPIVAEHAIYWQRDGSNYWRAGAAAFGTPW
jgi:hypothetical protein